MTWPVEDIPDEDFLYFFIHNQDIGYDQDNQPVVKEAALSNTPKDGPNKSCDWSRYATPKETQALLGKQHRTGKTVFKNPAAFFVYAHGVELWRSVHQEGREYPEQEVRHDPIENQPEPTGKPNNRAHAIILGDKPDKLRVLMARRAVWKIHPPPTKAEMKAYRKELS